MTEKEKAQRLYEICLIEADVRREHEALISQRESEAFEVWSKLTKEREVATKAWFEAMESRDAAFNHWMRLCEEDRHAALASTPYTDTETDN